MYIRDRKGRREVIVHVNVTPELVGKHVLLISRKVVVGWFYLQPQNRNVLKLTPLVRSREAWRHLCALGSVVVPGERRCQRRCHVTAWSCPPGINTAKVKGRGGKARYLILLGACSVRGEVVQVSRLGARRRWATGAVLCCAAPWPGAGAPPDSLLGKLRHSTGRRPEGAVP